MRYEDTSGSFSNAASGTPDARDDTDNLAAGSRSAATGNAISGEGTVTGAAGADIVGNAPGQIVALQGANGSDTADGNGALHADGRYGTLTMQQDGAYSYRTKGAAPENARDVFSYTLADQSGGRDTALLAIDIGHTPSVAENAQQIVPGPDGVVVLPAGVDISDVHVVGRNLVIDMPDGTQMVIIDGAVFVPQLVQNDNIEIPPATLAQLLIDSEPKPGAGPPQSGGGNFIEPVGPLDPGVPLGDLLPPTELVFPQPEPEEVDNAVNSEPEIIIIPDGQPGAVNAVDSVDESGLPERGSEPEGTLEPQNIETTTGVISITADDGIDNVTINGVEIDSVGDTIVTPRGILTITSIDLDSGQIGYSYTNTDNTTDGVDDFDDFTIVITDDDGDTATGTLHIDILDDEPIARNDTDSVTLQNTTATGNVMTAVGTTNSPAGVDTVGADDATLTAVQGVGLADTTFDINGNLVVQGEFGTLTIDAEGNYTYQLTGAFPEAADTDVFTYTLTDGDGDTATATLTINVPGNPNDIPEILRADDTLVDEDGLEGANVDAGRPGEVDSTESATDTGQILVDFKGDVPANLLDAIAFINPSSLNGQLTTPGGVPITFTVNGSGQLVGSDGTNDVIIIDFTAAVPQSGGQVLYTYTVELLGPVAQPDPGTEDTIDLTGITVQVTDSNGDTDSATFDATIVDDLPVAVEPPPPDPQDPTPGIIFGRVDEDDLDEENGDNTTGNDDHLDGDDAPIDDSGDSDATTTGGPAGSLNALFSVGSDAPLTISLSSDPAAIAALEAQGLSSNGHALLYVVNGTNTVLTAYADLDNNGDLDPGEAVAGNEVFTLTVGADGSWLFNLQDQIDHSEPGTEDNVQIDFGAVVIGTDADGDPVAAAGGAFIVDVDDDMPQPFDSNPNDENDECPDPVVASNQPGTEVNDVPLNLPPVGADQPGHLTFGVENGDPVLDGNNDPVMSNGQPLFYFIDPNDPTILEGRTSEGADPVFRIDLDLDSNSYDFELLGDITSEVAVSIDNLESIGGGNVDAKAIDVPGTPFDLILSTQSPETINTSADWIGVGGGQSLSDDDVVRVDFIQNAFTTGSGGGAVLNYGEYYTVTSYRQDIGGLNNVQFANFTVTAINVVESGNPSDPADGDDVFFGDANDTIVTDTNLVIYDDAGVEVDIAAYNAGNGAAPDLVVTENPDGSWTITGMPQDFDFEITSDSGFEAVEVLAVDGTDTFKLGVIDLTRSEQVEVDFTVPIILTDADGDPVTCDIDVFLTPGVSAQADAATVDDDGLANANPLGTADIDANANDDNAGEPGDTEAVFVGQLNAGGGSGTFTFSLVAPAGTVMVGQEEVEITGTGTLLTGTIVGGDRDGEDLFEISLNEDTGVYTVTLLLNVLHEDTGLNDENGTDLSLGIGYEVTDGTTTSAGAINIIFNDDVPTARDDTDTVPSNTDTATGNVITGVDTTTAGDTGDDTKGADGATVTAVTGFEGAVGVPDGADLVVEGEWGTLTIGADGEYSYVRDADAPDGETDTFTYTLTDGDGDEDTATLTITIINGSPTVDVPTGQEAGTLVDEAGLPARVISLISEPEGSGEADDPAPASDDSERTDGTITFTPGDEPATVTIDGAGAGGPVTITAAGQTVVGQYGTLTIDSFDAAGTITYHYILADNTSGNTTHDDFSVVVTDVDGQTANGTLVINIVDDVPTAENDTDSIASGDDTATGNVITAVGTTNSGADTVGADNATVTAVTGFGGSVGVVNGDGDLVVDGEFGTLTIGSDGEYSYVRDADAPDGETDTFTYTLTDGDTDTDTATLVITIANDTPTVDVPTGEEAGTSVDEKGLSGARGVGESEGSGEEAAGGVDGDTSERTDGTITFTPGDTPATVTIDGAGLGGPVTITAAGQTIVGQYGTLTIDSYSAAGTITYHYILADNTSGNTTHDDFDVVVTDADGQTASGTLVIDIVDDVPNARNDTDSIASGDDTATGNVITAVGTTNAGADTLGADNATVTAVTGFAGAVGVVNGDGDLVVDGEFGTLTIGSDGEYSYVRDADAPDGETDTFTYTLTDGDTDTDTATLVITIANGTPSTDENDPAVVDDEGLAGGITGGDGDTVVPDSDGDGDESTFGGTLNFDFGSDGGGEVTLADMDGDTATVGTEDIEYSWDAGTNTLTAEITSGDRAGTDLFQVTIDPTNGDYSVTLLENVLHEDDDSNTEDPDASATITYTVTDSDGQEATGTLTINFDDDIPELFDSSDAEPDAVEPLTWNGVFDFGIGADSQEQYGLTAHDISVALTGTLGDGTLAQEIQNVQVDLDSATADTESFSFSFDYDSNPTDLDDTADSTATGTIVFDKDAGTYTVTLDDPIKTYDTINTGNTISKTSYNTDGQSEAQPEIVVSQLASDFYVRFTGDNGNLVSAPTNGTWAQGETITGTQGWVSISGDTNGVSSDTLQNTEVLDMDFFVTDPGAAGTATEATADNVFIKIGQFNSGTEDLVVILKLVDPDTNAETTRAIVVDSADVWLSSETNPYGITFATGEDGVIIIESNDYNFGTENYQIVGMQLLTSTNGITSAANVAIDLDRDTGDSGASAMTDEFDAATSDSDVIKIVDIGFIRVTTNTQDIHLDFEATVTDADGDSLSQTLSINPVVDTLAATSSFKTASVDSQSLLSEDSSTSNKGHGRSFEAANSNHALLGAIAAAGLASAPAAAKPGGSDGEQDSAQLTSLSLDSGSKQSSTEESQASHTLAGETKEQVEDVAKSDGPKGHSNDNAGDHSLTNGDAHEAQAPAELLGGTDAPVQDAPAQSSLTSGGVAMPSAEMVLAAQGEDGDKGEAKTTGDVGKVLADALAGGGDGANLDAVIDAHANRGDGGDKGASDALASLGQGTGSHWDTAGLAHFPGGHAQFTMESIQLHPDAVQPAA